MAQSLLSIYEATNDIATAFDECLLVSDDQLRQDLGTITNDVKDIVKKETSSLIKQPPEDLIETQLAIINRLESIGNHSAEIEQGTSATLETWKDKIDVIKAKEQEGVELESLHEEITNVKSAKVYYETLLKATATEAQTKALLGLASAYQKSRKGTKFSRWLGQQVAVHAGIVKRTIEEELSVAMKGFKLPLNDIGSPVISTIARCLNQLARLQVTCQPCLTEEDRIKVVILANELTSDLWGIQLLAKPFIVRFQYHFCLERATNRIDRPEWFVAFVIQTVRDMAHVIESKLQPALHNVGWSESERIYVDVLSQFVRQLVKTVHSRLESIWSKLETEDALICHTMDEVLAGDRTLMGEFGYGSSSNSWPTMSGFFFLNEERIAAWLRSDVKFAKERMMSILDSTTSWQSLGKVLHLKVNRGDGAMDERDFATECSEAIMTMIDSLGSRIDLCKEDDLNERNIPIRFAETVQCELIRFFLTLVAQRTNRYERLNTLQPILEALLDWRLKPRYVNMKRSTASRGPRMLLFRGGDLVKRVSAGVVDGYNSTHGENETKDSISDSWMFESIVEKAKSSLATEVHIEVDQALKGMRSLLKPYEKLTWNSQGSEMENGTRGEDVQREVSLELRPALSLLRTIFSTWREEINPVVRAQLVSSLSRVLEEFFLSFLLKRSFSQPGAKQFEVDMMALIRVLSQASDRTTLDVLPKLSAALRILAAPTNVLRTFIETQDSGVFDMDEIPKDVDFLSVARCRMSS